MNITIPTVQIPLFEDAFPESTAVDSARLIFNSSATRAMVYDPKNYPQPHDAPSVGIKYDSQKPRPSLLPFDSIEEILKVLEYGAQKYAPDNWKHVVPRSRYIDAAFRHMFQWQAGENNDQETNISHLAHAATNLLFLIHFQLNGENPRESN